MTCGPNGLHRVEWTHPRKKVIEVLCKRHEQELITALQVLGIGCQAEKTHDFFSCNRCDIEAAGEEPRFVYGLVG